MNTSGIVYLSIYTGSYNVTFQGKVEWLCYTNTTTNQSTITAKLYARKQNSSSATTGTSWNGYISIDGTKDSFSALSSTSIKNDWVLLKTYSKTINHNSDGTRTVAIGGSITGPSGTSLASATSSGSETITLPTVPRTSALTVFPTTIGSKLAYTINSNSSSFTHKVTYTCGTASGTIADGVAGGNYTWTVPTSLHSQLGSSSTSISCNISCQTYNGSTLVGTVTQTTTLTADESACKPTVSLTVVDSNSTTIALTGSSSKLIKGYSIAKAIATVTTKYNATLSSLKINSVSASSRTAVNFTATTNSYNAVATDSRGYQASASKTLDMINYVPLTCVATPYRPTQTGSVIKMDYSGNYFSGSFGSVSNALTLSWKWREKGASTWNNGGTLSPTINSSNNTYSGTIQCGSSFDYKKAYEFIVYATDKLVSTNSGTRQVSKGQGALEVYETGIKLCGISIVLEVVDEW